MVSDTHNQPIAAVKPASTQRPMLMQWDELTCQQTQSVRTGKSLLQLEEVCFLVPGHWGVSNIEEGFKQKARQRSSRLFGGQILFNSLPS